MKTSICAQFFTFKLIFVLGALTRVDGVRINRLQVPEVTQLGDPVVLDCDYTLEESLDEGLVVKWFFNEKPTPIYQWIPNKKPQELGILKGRLDLEYSASTDTNSVHRALHIIQPGPDLSGDYTCLVSTFSSEDRKTKRMLVFVPEKRLELRQERVGDGIMQVVCSAEGVFPKPNMSLHVGNSEVNSSTVAVLERAGLFDIRATAEVPSLNGPEEFSCELRIPQANYTVRKEAIYYPVNDSSIFHSPSTILESVLIILHVLLVLPCLQAAHALNCLSASTFFPNTSSAMGKLHAKQPTLLINFYTTTTWIHAIIKICLF